MRDRSPLTSRTARRAIRAAALLPLAAGLAACSSASGAAGAASSGSCDGVSGAHHAKLVWETAPGKVEARCVGFSGATISAAALIAKSKVELGTQQYSFGTAVCQLDDVPAHYSQCLPSGQDYWALFVSHGGKAWTSPPTGISDITLHPGDLLGLRYDSPQGNPAPPPPPARV